MKFFGLEAFPLCYKRDSTSLPTELIGDEDNVIGSVRPSVRLFLLYLLKRLSVDLEFWLVTRS